jgi:hypothetical protein
LGHDALDRAEERAALQRVLGDFVEVRFGAPREARDDAANGIERAPSGFDALGAYQQRRAAASDRAAKLFEQPRFPDPGGSGDKHDPSAARPEIAAATVQLGEFRYPADEAPPSEWRDDHPQFVRAGRPRRASIAI